MSARLVHLALGAASRELRREVRRGAVWADAHLTGNRGKGRAEVQLDSSLGFDELRHPELGDSPAPATVIVVVATTGTGGA